MLPSSVDFTAASFLAFTMSSDEGMDWYYSHCIALSPTSIQFRHQLDCSPLVPNFYNYTSHPILRSSDCRR